MRNLTGSAIFWRYILMTKEERRKKRRIRRIRNMLLCLLMLVGACAALFFGIRWIHAWAESRSMEPAAVWDSMEESSWEESQKEENSTLPSAQENSDQEESSAGAAPEQELFAPRAAETTRPSEYIASTRIRRDVKEASSLMTSAVREFDGAARNEIENCASYLADTADSLISASDDLASILPYLDITMEGGQKALDSAGDALDGTVSLIGSFDQSLGKTIENLGKLKEDVHEIQSSVNVKTVLEDALGVDLDDYAGNTQELAEFISSPVELDTQTLYPIENYGSSMTPFYTILAIWVGCLLLVSIFKVNVRQNGDLRMKRFRHYHLYGGRYLLFLTFSIIQAVVMCLGDLHILGIQCLAPGRFILTGILAAITFSNIVYTLTICFGDVGKAIAIVLLIIQVAGAGGTFPVELTPSFFNNLNPFMPFTHGINAMRECIGGFYGNSYLFSLIKMCVYFPIFFIFGTVFRKPLIRMMNFFHRKLDETGLM